MLKRLPLICGKLLQSLFKGSILFFFQSYLVFQYTQKMCSHLAHTYFSLCPSPHLPQTRWRWTMQWLPRLIWKRTGTISSAWSTHPWHHTSLCCIDLALKQKSLLSWRGINWCLHQSSKYISKGYLRLLVQFHLLKSFMNKLMLNKPPRMRNKLFHKPMQA